MKKVAGIRFMFMRDGVFYVRKAIPAPLRMHYPTPKGFKSDITVSLGTSEKKEALKRYSLAMGKITAEFESLLSLAVSSKANDRHIPPKTLAPTRSIETISENEFRVVTQRWLDTIKERAEASRSQFPYLSDDATQDAIQNLQDEQADLQRQSRDKTYFEATELMEQFFHDEGFTNKFSGKRTTILLRAFTAQLHAEAEGSETYLQSPFLQEFLPDLRVATDNDVSFDYVAELYRQKKSVTLKPMSYKQTVEYVRLVTQLLPKSKFIHQIDRSDCRYVRDIISQLPSNYRKIFPGMSPEQAIEANKSAGKPLMTERTANGYPRSLFTGKNDYHLPRFSRATLQSFEECLPTLARAARDKAVILTTMPYVGRNEQPDLRLVSEQLLQIINKTDADPAFLTKLLHAVLHTGKLAEEETIANKKLFSKLRKLGLLEKVGRKPKGMPQLYSIQKELRQLRNWINRA